MEKNLELGPHSFEHVYLLPHCMRSFQFLAPGIVEPKLHQSPVSRQTPSTPDTTSWGLKAPHISPNETPGVNPP